MNAFERMALDLLTQPGEPARPLPGAARNLSRPTVRSQFGEAIVRLKDHGGLPLVDIATYLGESRQAVRAAYKAVKLEKENAQD